MSKMGWYVVQTKVSKEYVAAIAIAEKGFGVYCPLKVVTVSHAGKRADQERCLFPRYLFVSANHPGLECGEINFARGVANKGLLCFRQQEKSAPYVVKEAIMEGIRKRESAARARAGEIRSGYQPGDQFTIAVGPFASLDAAYMGEEKGKVTVIVTLFGRGNVIEIPIEELPLKAGGIDNAVA